MIPTLYEPFRHWSDGGSVYILSDLHFDLNDPPKMVHRSTVKVYYVKGVSEMVL